jgi:4-guanidinobutyraldehyde dehydrogenase / NAD-dependent aldehyde dehydrogenase
MTQTVDDALTNLSVRSQAFVDGAYVDAASGETFDCINPATGRTIASVAAGDAEDIDRAVNGARAAFESGVWSRLAPKKRKRVLVRLAELVREHRDELALLETLDMGKPIRDSRTVDVPLAAECIAYYGEAIDKVYDEVAPTGPGDVVKLVREPLGVVGAVVPWNFPLLMASWKVGPALATGCSVVLKPAEQSPLTALRLAELAARGGSAGRRAAGRARLRRDRGPGARPPHGRRPRRVHGLDRGRQALPALLGGVEHEAACARVRR